MRAPSDRYDVALLGGGLAGLTLAIQLKQARPETSILVLEKREGPAPLAAFKVGESTVPAGAHYFADVVGMDEHLHKEQLIKCGLRYFPPGDGNRDITNRVEMGPPAFPPHDNFQIDRGLFENKLASRARSLGIEVAQGSRVGEIELNSDGQDHTVNFQHFGEPAKTSARWVVDAAGRASLLKRKLGLATDSGHHINSSWFRLGGGLDIEDWGRDNATWMGAMSEPGLRKNSTNHLLGEGYWIWIIPLSTGPVSIGVCADPRYHPFEEINTFDTLLDWFRKYEPQLAETVEKRIDDIEDFLRVEDFAYGVERISSADRWALVGEAGAFADPFFSPGSDFICFSNTFASDLIKRHLDGEDISSRMDYYNGLYQRAFEYVMAKYRDIYPIFGNPWVSCGMLTWSFYSNHTGITLLTLKNKLTDFEFMKSVDADLDRLFQLNINMHKVFKQWHELENKERPAAFLKVFPVLVTGLLGLIKDYPDDDAIREELRSHVTNSEAMAVVMFHKAASALPEAPPADKAVNPYRLGLDPDKWEADGMFDGPGLTLEEAHRITPGVEVLWDDSVNPFEGFGGGPPASVAGAAGVGGGPPPGVGGGPPPGVAGGPPAGVAGGPPPGVAG
jgi:flavin-dependent dehydrogenase